MNKLLKITAVAVSAIVAIMVLGVAALVILVNPNDYRADISKLALNAAGVELKLEGDLSWRFYPVLGFGANTVSLALQPGAPQLVSMGELTVGIKIIPLLSKKIEVDALEIDRLQANLLVNERGENNWQLPASAEKSTVENSAKESPAAESATTIPDISIPVIRVKNSAVNYQDQQAGQTYLVDLPLVELRNVNLQDPFTFFLQANVKDGGALSVASTLEGQVSADLNRSNYAVKDLQVNADVAGIFEKPVTLMVNAEAEFNQGQDSAQLTITKLQLANVIARADFDLQTISSALSVSGKVATENFDARKLMSALGLPAVETQSPNALGRVQLSTQLAATPGSVSAKPISINVDESTLGGEVSIVDVDKQTIRFALQLDKLNADNYLPPVSTATPVTAPAAGDVAAELLPVDLLRSLNMQGTFNAGEIIFQKIPVKNIALKVSALDGDIRITDLGAKLMQGSLAGKVTVDARKTKPVIATNIDLTNVEVGEILKPFTPLQLLTGKTSLTLATTTEGNTIDALIQQALGQINLSMAETIIHGVNVNEVALSAVKNKLGDFTQLYPDYENKLPKALKSDTEVRSLLANMKVEKGHLLMPSFNADTTQGTFTATGDIDLLNKGFDYQFGIVLAALSGNKYLSGVQWPVRCKGGLATPVAEWCKPDSKSVNKILEQAAAKAIKDKGAQKIGEKLGVQAEDEAAAKEALRAKAKEEEDRAKQKVNDAINKKLNKLFDK